MCVCVCVTSVGHVRDETCGPEASHTHTHTQENTAVRYQYMLLMNTRAASRLHLILFISVFSL